MWEYPFVCDKIQGWFSPETRNMSIMDAGSGVTFFPYYLKERLGCDIFCYDYDKRFRILFEDINAKSNQKVEFLNGDISMIPVDDASFDIVYCISVLEHTKNYEQTLKEFNRILKPGGKFIVTFDIAPNRDYEIIPEEADFLFNLMNRNFKVNEYLLADHQSYIEQTLNLDWKLTTDYVKKFDIPALPWHPNTEDFRNLTIACYVFEKI